MRRPPSHRGEYQSPVSHGDELPRPNVYVTTRLVEGRANTYGALGIAAALLFSLVLVGRLFVLSAEPNASLAQHSSRNR